MARQEIIAYLEKTHSLPDGLHIINGLNGQEIVSITGGGRAIRAFKTEGREIVDVVERVVKFHAQASKNEPFSEKRVAFLRWLADKAAGRP